MDKTLQRYDEEAREVARQREALEHLTMRQMSARVKRELGIPASAITMYQSNDADINRVAWSACIDGVGWLSITQNFTGQWDPKSEAERSARIEIYIELLVGGQDLVDSIRAHD